EDGIRDSSVTGVQTCALPICAVDVDVDEAVAHAGGVDHALQRGKLDALAAAVALGSGRKLLGALGHLGLDLGVRRDLVDQAPLRSEERRVGKEGGVRGRVQAK